MTTDLSLIRSIIGENIRRIRKERNLKVEDLAGEAGLVKGYWYQIEAGESNVTIDALGKIAKALSATVQDLLSGPGRAAYAQSEAPPNKKPKRRKAS